MRAIFTRDQRIPHCSCYGLIVIWTPKWKKKENYLRISYHATGTFLRAWVQIDILRSVNLFLWAFIGQKRIKKFDNWCKKFATFYYLAVILWYASLCEWKSSCVEFCITLRNKFCVVPRSWMTRNDFPIKIFSIERKRWKIKVPG